MADATTMPPQAVMIQMIHGKLLSRCISLVAELDIADHLKVGPKDADTLATATGMNPDALYRVMRMLASADIFEELSDRQFQNNALSDTLRSDAPGSTRGYARWLGTEFHWQLACDLDYSVQTGKPSVLKRQPDKSPFDILAQDPGAQERFNDAMSGVSIADGTAIVHSYDFTRFDRIMDVGGGHGMLAMMIAQAAPHAHVSVLDLPHVTEGAAERFAQDEAANRLKAIGGDFRKHVPGPVDLCVLKNTIHDWDDQTSSHILTNCREALADDGRILLCEYLVGEGLEALASRLLDIEMLVGPGGRERTVEEFERVLADAGLKLNQVVETPTPIRLIEAVEA